MPNAADHTYMTLNAIALNKHLLFPEELARDYCQYPDMYFSTPEKVQKYYFETKGIQYHYPPTVSYCDLYRYWRMEHGQCVRKAFHNANFDNMHRGFKHYIKKTLEEPESECWKYAGCLIHALQDALIGVHVLENAGGTDINFLDRLGYFKQDPANRLMAFPATGYPMLQDYAPKVLGRTAQEFALFLYSRYVLLGNVSRAAAFRAIMEMELNDNSEAAYREVKIAFQNAVKLSADVLFTLYMLRQCRAQDYFVPISSLTELVPIEFPFGGGGGAYRFASYTVNAAYSKQNQKIPLETMADGKITESKQGFAFGVHVMGGLMFRLPSKDYETFSATIGLHPQCDYNSTLKVLVINANKQVDEIQFKAIDDARRVIIKKPRGQFGFRMLSQMARGVIVIANPILSID